MLSTKSFASAPLPPEKVVKVKILKSIFVAGVARAVGDVVPLALGDAQSLRCSVPPTVEIL
jgi:hypothetical protein